MKLKSLLAWTLAIVVVLILVGVAAIKLLFPPQKVVAALIPKFEDALDRPIEYGDVDVSIFSGLGVTIHDIEVKNDPGFIREDFLRISRLECRLRFWPLLHGNIEIRQLMLVDPELYLIKKVDGVTNYYEEQVDINAPGDEEALIEAMAFENFSVHNGRVIRRNDSTSVKWVVGGIDFSSQMKVNGRLDVKGHLEADSLALLTELDDFISYPAGVSADYAMTYYPEGESLLVESCELAVENLAVRVSGRIQNMGAGADVDLAVIAPGIKLRELENSALLNAFPPLRDLQLGGQLRLDATYKGRAGDHNADNLRGKITLTNLTLSSPRLDADIQVKLAELNFNSQSVSLFTEGAQIGEVPASFRLAVDNFDDPNVSAEVAFTSGLGLLSQFAQLDPESKFSGTAEVSLSGFARWQERENLRLLGSLKLSDVSYNSPRLLTPIDNLELDCQFLGKDVQVQSLHLDADDSELDLEGRLINFSNYLVALGRTARKPLLDFKLHAKSLDLDNLLGLSKPEPEIDSAEIRLPLLALFPNFDASGRLDIEESTLHGVEMKDFKARFLMLNRVVQIDSASCKLFKGRVEGEIFADFSDSISYGWEMDAHAGNVEIDNLLTQLIGYPDHLSGRTDLMVNFSGGSARSGSNSATGSGSILIGAGELEDLAPIEFLADRLGLKSLEKGKFHSLRGQFQIADSTLELTDLSLTQGKVEHRINGMIGYDGTLDLSTESTIPASESGSLHLPDSYRRMWKDWDGAVLKLHIGGNSEAPVVVIQELLPGRRGDYREVVELQNVLNSLLEN